MTLGLIRICLSRFWTSSFIAWTSTDEVHLESDAEVSIGRSSSLLLFLVGGILTFGALSYANKGLTISSAI